MCVYKIIYKALLRPVFTRYSETWTLKQEKKTYCKGGNDKA